MRWLLKKLAILPMACFIILLAPALNGPAGHVLDPGLDPTAIQDTQIQHAIECGLHAAGA
jgi:hypothetical protein